MIEFCLDSMLTVVLFVSGLALFAFWAAVLMFTVGIIHKIYLRFRRE